MSIEALNKEIDRLYTKVKNGTMEQNSMELDTYMWLSELKDRRKRDNSLLEASKLFSNCEYVILKFKNGANTIKEEIEISDIPFSDYAFCKVENIDFNIELIQSCEITLDIRPVFTIKEFKLSN